MRKHKEQKKKEDPDSKKSGYSHLKWPTIIMIIVIILLIILLDYFYRTGNI